MKKDIRDLDDFVELKLPEIKQREIPFESRLRDELKKRGVMFVKNKPTLEGWPDRTAVGFGRIRLVEVKAQEGELSPVQEAMHARLKAHGVRVVVVYGPDVNRAATYILKGLRGY